MAQEGQRFLLRFITEKSTFSFRIAELDALLLNVGVDPTTAYDRAQPAVTCRDIQTACPYVEVVLPSAAVAARLCEDAILLRDALEIWGQGTTHAEAAAACASFPEALKAPYYASAQDGSPTWRCDVEAYGFSFPQPAQEAKRAAFAEVFARHGKVRLGRPDHLFRIIERYAAGTTAKSTADDRAADTTIPTRVYVGRVAGESKRREMVARCDLKERVYLGPTALDNELALVMASVARCGKNSLVLDPFAGTGSILVACALFGSNCFGTDIDWKVLRGKTLDQNDGAGRRRGALPKGQTIVVTKASGDLGTPDAEGQRKTAFSNFRQYGLPVPELLRLDSSRFFEHYRGASQDFYDAIVTDPPYGIRAGARCSGMAKDVKPVPEHLRADHVPATQTYPVADVLADLLEIAAVSLRVDGRLAYLLPATVDFDPEHDLPMHPALEYVAACAQPISAKYSRWLIVMRKRQKWTPAENTPEVRALVRTSADAPYVALSKKLAEPARTPASRETADKAAWAP